MSTFLTAWALLACAFCLLAGLVAGLGVLADLWLDRRAVRRAQDAVDEARVVAMFGQRVPSQRQPGSAS